MLGQSSKDLTMRLGAGKPARSNPGTVAENPGDGRGPEKRRGVGWGMRPITQAALDETASNLPHLRKPLAITCGEHRQEPGANVRQGMPPTSHELLRAGSQPCGLSNGRRQHSSVLRRWPSGRTATTAYDGARFKSVRALDVLIDMR